MISQIQVVSTSKVLKYGQLSFSGHTLLACRNLDTYKLQKTLPLLPDEVSVILITKAKQFLLNWIGFTEPTLHKKNKKCHFSLGTVSACAVFLGICYKYINM